MTFSMHVDVLPPGCSVEAFEEDGDFVRFRAVEADGTEHGMTERYAKFGEIRLQWERLVRL